MSCVLFLSAVCVLFFESVLSEEGGEPGEAFLEEAAVGVLPAFALLFCSATAWVKAGENELSSRPRDVCVCPLATLGVGGGAGGLTAIGSIGP